MTQTYRVGGMTCEGCVRAVTRAIKRAAPGAEITVDLAAGAVAIDAAVDVPIVKRAVEEAGFRFDGPA